MSGAETNTYPLSADEAAAVLARDPVGNVELLTTLRYDADVRCFGVLRSGNMTKFSIPNIVRKEGGGRQAGKPAATGDAPPEIEYIGILVIGREGLDERLTARIATEDVDALDALIAALPHGISRIVVQRAWMLPALTAAFHLVPDGETETLFSLAAIPTLPTTGVRPLTMADVPMMAASATLWGRLGLVDALRAGFRPFGIVRGERVIACAMAANVTMWTEEVMSVWTALRHRGQGLATAVVAATTADIIARGKIATYVAAVTNHASQRVAEKIGFQRAYDITAYRIRR